MTEMVNGMSQSVDTQSSQPSPAQSSANVTSTSQSTSAGHEPSERTFRQSEVNEIVKRAKHDALETYKRVSTEQPQYAAQKYGETLQSPTSQVSGQFNEDHYRKIASEEAQRHFETVRQEAYQKAQDENAQRMVQNFFAKVSKGKEKYQDFDSVTGDVDLARFPNVVQILGEYVENSEDLFYHLGNDRFKLNMLEDMANRSPNDALIAAKKLSQSIKDNDSAKHIRIPNEPLSQLRPTNAGTDNGAMSVKDYRRKYKG